MFLVDPLNPIRMVPVIDWDREYYQTVPFDKANLEESKRWYNTTSGETYTQKFINRDKPKNQIITDIEGVTAVLIKCETGQEFPITLVDTETEFTGLLASCYELTVDFSLANRGNGNYFLKYFYTDEEDNDFEWCSEPIEVADEWPNTRCHEYTHSRNDWMVFQHVLDDPEPFIGLVRIECDIRAFKPGSIDTVYDDQNANVTMVDGVAFRQFTWNSGPIPDWRVDQINRIFLCDQVKIDSQYYTKSEGSQWEETRTENSVFSEQKLVISESENRFQYQLDTSGITDEMMAILKTIDRFGNTTNISVANRIKKYSKLQSISLFNPTGAIFSMTIEATSEDGINNMPPQTFIVNGEPMRNFEWPYLFDRPKTFKVTGIEGIPLDIIIAYYKLDALPGEGSGGTVGSGRIRSGGFYHGTPEEFALDFDVDTGLGFPDGPYAGCAVCNGENNTPNLLGRMLIGADGITGIAEEYPVNEEGGEWEKQIMLTDLPVLQHKIFAPHLPGGTPPLPSSFVQIDADGFASPDGTGLSTDDYYRINKATGPTATDATLGNTNKLGGKNGDGTGGVGPTFSVKGKYYSIIFWKQIA